jgi:hypothetical protein
LAGHDPAVPFSSFYKPLSDRGEHRFDAAQNLAKGLASLHTFRMSFDMPACASMTSLAQAEGRIDGCGRRPGPPDRRLDGSVLDQLFLHLRDYLDAFVKASSEFGQATFI